LRVWHGTKAAHWFGATARISGVFSAKKA